MKTVAATGDGILMCVALLLVAGATTAMAAGRKADASATEASTGQWPSPVTWQPDPRAVKSGLYIAPRPPAQRERVAFTVTEPSGVARAGWPVRGGIPLHRGELTDPGRIRLLDASGREVPVQGMATAFWPERSIRFLCIDFLANLKGGQERRYTLEYGQAVRAKAATPVKVTATRRGKTVTVDTGTMLLRCAAGKQFLRISLGRGGRKLGPVTGKAVVCRTAGGEGPVEHPLVIEDVRVAERGPVQATLHLTGRYGEAKAFKPADAADKDVWRYPVSIFLRVHAGGSRVYVQHTFGYNGDEYSDFVQSYGLTIPTGLSDGKFLYGTDEQRPTEAPLGVRLNQFAHDQWALGGKAAAQGRRFGGWGAIEGGGLRVLVALREAWQNWPVAIAAEANGDLTYEILGEKPGRALDLRYEEEGGKPCRMIDSHSMFFGPKLTLYYSGPVRKMRARARGLVKIHELLLDVSAGQPRAAAAATGRAHHKPLVPWPGQQRYRETKALGHIGVYGDAKWDFMKHYYSVMFDSLAMTHEANGLYGWVDWGDLPMCNKPTGGRFKMEMDGGVGWSNAERALAPYFYHYAAGGGRRFLDLGRAMVHHTIGIDTEHPGGDDKHGGYHRHNQVHWRHKGAGTRQGGFRGWHNYYWLTGDPEVGRLILREGIDSPAQRSQMDLRPERKRLRVGYDYQHCASHLLAHVCWITTGDWRYARAHRPIVKLWKICGEKARPTRRGYLFFDVKDGEPVGYQLAGRGPQLGYWLTYGGDDLLLDWAALTGDPVAVDAILLQGKLHGTGSTARGVRSLYNSPEALYLALAYLQPDHPHLKRLLTGRLWQHPNLAKFRSEGLTTSGRYKSAEDWDRYGTYMYRKNGFSINGAEGLEVLHLMRAMELLGTSPAP